MTYAQNPDWRNSSLLDTFPGRTAGEATLEGWVAMPIQDPAGTAELLRSGGQRVAAPGSRRSHSVQWEVHPTGIVTPVLRFRPEDMLTLSRGFAAMSLHPRSSGDGMVWRVSGTTMPSLVTATLLKASPIMAAVVHPDRALRPEATLWVGSSVPTVCSPAGFQGAFQEAQDTRVDSLILRAFSPPQGGGEAVAQARFLSAILTVAESEKGLRNSKGAYTWEWLFQHDALPAHSHRFHFAGEWWEAWKYCQGSTKCNKYFTLEGEPVPVPLSSPMWVRRMAADAPFVEYAS